MSRIPFLRPLMFISLWLTSGTGSQALEIGDNSLYLSYRDYETILSKQHSGIVFFNACRLRSGGRAMIFFDQLDRGGKYFETNGDTTLAFKEIMNVEGGFYVRDAGRLRYIDKRDNVLVGLAHSRLAMLEADGLEFFRMTSTDGQCSE